MATSTKYVGRKWQTASTAAIIPCPCTSHSSSTAGAAAQYVPINGTTAVMAANAEGRKQRYAIRSNGCSRVDID